MKLRSLKIGLTRSVFFIIGVAITSFSAVAQDCLDGYFSGTNNYVEEITGQRPMSMMDFIVKNKAALA